MTVKEIFELRKQGKIEEAYEAIKPMYAAHKGKYTSICMFWTGSDIFKLRLKQGRVDEATKIFHALKHVLPYINDTDGKAMAFMQYAARRLAKFSRQDDSRKESTDDSQKTVRQSAKEERISVPEGVVAKLEEERICVPEEEDVSKSVKEGVSKSVKEDVRKPEDNDVSELKEDYSGHLIVGLDEGIIDRPNNKRKVLKNKKIKQ